MINENIFDDFEFEQPNTITHDNFGSMKIKPELFISLVKILKIISNESSENTINIKNSKLLHDIKSGIAYCDLKEIFGPSLSMDIVDPKKTIPLMMEFKNCDSDITIFDGDHYVISGGKIKLNLFKQSVITELEMALMDISNSTTIFSITIEKDESKKIKALEKNADYILLHVKDNTLKAISRYDGAEEILKYCFDKTWNDEEPDHSFRSNKLIPVDADSYKINMVKTFDNKYCLIKECNIEKLKLNIMEICDVTDNSISFSDLV